MATYYSTSSSSASTATSNLSAGGPDTNSPLAVFGEGFVYSNYLNSYSPSLTDSERRKEITKYEVQEGDTVSGIADRFGITAETILWANDLSDPDHISVGEEIVILPVSGVRHIVSEGETVSEIASFYNAEREKILEFNEIEDPGMIKIGQLLVVPGGEKPASLDYSSPSTYSHLPSSSSLGNPVPGSRISQGLHFNNAIDLAIGCGTPVRASAYGRVLEAPVYGWNGGYGLYVKVKHSNGVQTLYSHLSEVYVSPGEEVAKGQRLGLVGSTGKSTGCHVHFEVRGAQNPLAY